MSHANGVVRFQSDGTIMFYEYNGTVDIIIPKLFKSFQELKDNWRNVENYDVKCTCDKEPEIVEIFTDYGDGFYFNGKACRHCMVIISPIDVMNVEDSTDGYPDWYDLVHFGDSPSEE